MRDNDMHDASWHHKLDRVRTELANERTILAYVRTALTFLVAGLAFVRFFNHPYIEIVGWVFMPIGVVVLVVGLVRFGRTGKNIKIIK
ncbi:MAG: DUF202 domain-containing protein [candidate division Zixibacteria bacterium]|nr:DUF202 domain-containing protein [candidate division Zixibacteria bacterium]